LARGLLYPVQMKLFSNRTPAQATFKPQIGRGTTLRLRTSRHFESQRNWAATGVTALCATVIIGAAVAVFVA